VISDQQAAAAVSWVWKGHLHLALLASCIVCACFSLAAGIASSSRIISLLCHTPLFPCCASSEVARLREQCRHQERLLAEQEHHHQRVVAALRDEADDLRGQVLGAIDDITRLQEQLAVAQQRIAHLEQRLQWAAEEHAHAETSSVFRRLARD
jgi:flagellar motility protein MotE (MotC chaperone)